MRLYVEKYDEHEGFLLADFVSNRDYLEFCRSIDSRVFPEDFRTMLYLDNLFFTTGDQPIEGAVYLMPDTLLRFDWVKEPGYGNLQETREFSDIFSFRTNANFRGGSFFGSPVSYRATRISSKNRWFGRPCRADQLTDQIEIVVRNVGQGNWNEIYSEGACQVIFDLGTSIHFSNQETRRIIDSGNTFNGSPTLVISHWDIDHYKGILQLSTSEISSLCCIFAPEVLVTETSKRVFKMLEDNNRFVVPIPELHSRKVKRKISSQVLFSGSRFILFQGEKSTNRNHSGLSLAVWAQDESVLLSGDSSYYQVFEHMIPAMPLNKKFNLVTPHHGGEAGKFNMSSFNAASAKLAITSTGRNSYGHPFNYVRQQLASCGFQWIRTDHMNSEISIRL
jgi:beta-lactamase superfamily II metal-dependent hydrolase